MPKALEELEDDEDEQGTREAKEGKVTDDDKRGALGDDDEGIDVERASDDDAPEDKAARRRARYTEIEQRSQAAEERARAAEERAARLEGQFQQFQQSQRREEGPKDDTDEQIKRLQAQRSQKLMLIRSAVGDENATAALANESMEIDGEIQRLRTQKIVREHFEQNRQPEVNVEQRMLISETPQVYSDPGIKSWAQGEFSRLVRNGSPPTIDTARKANQSALRAFGLGGRAASAPVESQRRAVGGLSSGGGSPTPTGKVKLSKSLRKIAAARSALLSPNEDDAVGQKKFAKRLREKGIA